MPSGAALRQCLMEAADDFASVMVAEIGQGMHISSVARATRAVTKVLEHSGIYSERLTAISNVGTAGKNPQNEDIREVETACMQHMESGGWTVGATSLYCQRLRTVSRGRYVQFTIVVVPTDAFATPLLTFSPTAISIRRSTVLPCCILALATFI